MGEDPVMNAIKLTDQQQSAVNAAVDAKKRSKPIAISGPAGSGKTLVAIEIARQLSAQTELLFDDVGSSRTTSALQQDGKGAHDSLTYLVTYTNQLKEYVEEQLGGAEAPRQSGIVVQTVHKYLKDYLKDNNVEIVYNGGRKKDIKKRDVFLQDYVEKNKVRLRLTGSLGDPRFLDEEIGWMLGRGIRGREAYLNESRTGRRTRLSTKQRETVITILRDYISYLQGSGTREKTIIDYDDVGNYVLHYSSKKSFRPLARHLVVDEVQDLPTSWTKALYKTVLGKAVFVGDAQQSIYGRGFTWNELIGQSIRPIHLKEGFRSTQQIYLASRSIMDFDTDSEELLNEDKTTRAEGAKPQLLFCKTKVAQTQRIEELVEQIRANNKTSSIAIGFPRRDDCYWELCHRFASDSSIVVSTLHSLKGLEADHVVLGNLDSDELDFNNEYTQEDTNRHLLYVGMTRAKRTLTLISATNRPAWMLSEIDSGFIEIIADENPFAYDSLIATRDERQRHSRQKFEEIVHRQVKQEEAVEQAQQNLLEYTSNKNAPLQSQEEIIEGLNQKLEEAQKKLERSKEKLQRQEDELRVFRAREKKDDIAKHESGEVADIAPAFFDNAKILIVGSLGIKSKLLPGIFKDLGLQKDAYEHVGYDEVTQSGFDVQELIGTLAYTDIFIGPTPHKAKGIGSCSSLVEFLRQHQADLPKITVFENDDGTLKRISKTDLKEAIIKSALYAFKHDI